MLSRSVSIVSIFLCIAFFSQFVRADDTEAELRQLEARLIYEAASQLVDDEKYDKAVRRFDRIISEYPETEYAQLSEAKKSEVAVLRIQTKPISGISRAGLVLFGTLFSTWSGIGTTILLDVEDVEVIGCVGCISGPLGGLAGSIRLTRDMKLSDGQASLINFGGAWGIWQAIGTAIVVDAEDKGVVGASMAGGAMGLAVSGAIVRGRYITPGMATMIRFGGLWGTWFAICGAMLVNLEDGDDILTSSIIGGDVGLITVAILSPKLKMSNARARLINISGIVGTLYGLGTNVLFEIDSKRDFWSVLGIGGVIGLAAGTYFTRNYDDESDYFSEEMVDYSISRRGRATDFSIIGLSHSDGTKSRIPDTGLRIPLLRSGF